MIPKVTYKLVTSKLPLAPGLFIQLHGRHCYLVVHGQLKHTVSKTKLGRFTNSFSGFIIHLVIQEIIVKFNIIASIPSPDPVIQCQNVGKVQSHLVWKEERIGSLLSALMITADDHIWIVFIYQVANVFRIVLIVFHLLHPLISITN